MCSVSHTVATEAFSPEVLRDPAQGLSKEATFVYQIKISVNIFMAQETSDNIWVTKKYFSEYQ